MSAVIDEVVVKQESSIANFNAEKKNMAGARHSGIATRLIVRLGAFVEENNSGGVYGPDATFVIGDRDRIPDISFVSLERIPPDDEPESKWYFAPDLAVEIISPNDIYYTVN
jgi:Uma2 family endonuclease